MCSLFRFFVHTLHRLRRKAQKVCQGAEGEIWHSRKGGVSGKVDNVNFFLTLQCQGRLIVVPIIGEVGEEGEQLLGKEEKGGSAPAGASIQ